MKFAATLSAIFLIVTTITSFAQDKGTDCNTLYQFQKYQNAINQCENEALTGNSRAYFLLGKMYYNGLGVPQNYENAMDYYHLSAVRDNSDAQIALGAHYGSTGDYKQSYAFFKLASDKGSDIATTGLAVVQPWLTAQDIVRAEKLKQLVNNAIDSNAAYYHGLAAL